jgi:hypothetical protein
LQFFFTIACSYTTQKKTFAFENIENKKSIGNMWSMCNQEKQSMLKHNNAESNNRKHTLGIMPHNQNE